MQDHEQNKTLIEMEIPVILNHGEFYQVVVKVESIGASVSNNITLFSSKFEVAISCNEQAVCLCYRCCNTNSSHYNNHNKRYVDEVSEVHAPSCTSTWPNQL